MDRRVPPVVLCVSILKHALMSRLPRQEIVTDQTTVRWMHPSRLVRRSRIRVAEIGQEATSIRRERATPIDQTLVVRCRHAGIARLRACMADQTTDPGAADRGRSVLIGWTIVARVTADLLSTDWTREVRLPGLSPSPCQTKGDARIRYVSCSDSTKYKG